MDIIILIAAVIAAYFVKGLTGFANTLVFSSILSYRMANKSITPLDLILGYPSNIYIAWKERKNISLKIVLSLSSLVLVGMIPGAFLLNNLNQNIIKIIFGMVVVVFGIETLLRQRKANNLKPNPIFLSAIGVLSGIVCGLFGIGAFLAAYINRTTENQHQFKGNICCVFLIENTVRILLYARLGIINSLVFISALKLVPFMITGLIAGMLCAKYIQERTSKTVIAGLLICSGLSLIYKNIW